MSINKAASLTPEEQLSLAKKYLKVLQDSYANGENYLLLESNILEAIPIFKAQQQLADYLDARDMLTRIYIDSHRFEQAKTTLLEDLHFSHQNMGQQHSLTGQIHRSLASYYYSIGNHQQGLIHAHKSLDISQIPSNYAKEPNKVYSNLKFLGTLYESFSDYNKAIEYTEASLKLGEKLWGHLTKGKLIWGDKSLLYAHVCHELSLVYYVKGNYKKSIKHAKEGQQQIVLSLGKDNNFNHYFYDALAKNYMALGDYSTAIVYLQKSVSLYKPNTPNIKKSLSTSYHNLATTYQKLNEHKTCLIYAEKSLKLKQAIFSIPHPKIADTLAVMSASYYQLGKSALAINHVQKALKIYENSTGSKNVKVATMYSYLSKYSTNLPEKEAYLQKAIAIHIDCTGPKHPVIATNYTELATIYLNQQNYIAALRTLQKATSCLFPNFIAQNIYTLPSLSNYLSPPSLLDILALKGHVLQQYFAASNDLTAIETAIKCYELASQLIEKTRQKYHTEASKLTLSKTANEVYGNGIAAIVTAHTYLATTLIHPLAFQFSEKAKGSLLLSALKDSIAKASVNIPAELLAEEQQLQIELTYLQKNIQKQEAQTGNKAEALTQQWQSDFFDNHQKHRALLKKLETDYPDYYLLKYQTQSASIEQLQKSLKNNQTLISYFEGTTQLHIFAITPTTVQQVVVEKPQNFEKLIKRFLKSINYFQYRNHVKIGRQLYDLLISPIQKYLPSTNSTSCPQLLIIPHGMLSYLPFESLICSTPPAPTPGASVYKNIDYLLQHFEVTYHYSATLWHYQKHQATPQWMNQPSRSFAGFAPVYDSASEVTETILKTTANACRSWVTRSNTISKEGNWLSLPHSETEVKNIEQLFEKKGLTASTYLRDKATKKKFSEVAQNAKYILISAHGLVNDEQTALSGLVFYPEEEIFNNNSTSTTANNQERSANTLPNINSSDDPILSMEETYHLNINADLVVLSSCDSGIGKLVKGEGMMAVNRGFIYAGAKNLIATLFKVYDKPSSLLTQYLFEAILAGDAYSTALRKAKLQLMEMDDVSPKSWCGFVLIGN